MPFWEWLIADIRERDRDVMFLSEAFTRPGMMARLGKVGFSQSYTYFTWRNTKAELSEYFSELNEPPLRDYRPNFFVNTPDINPFFLQDSGRAGFLIRAALATMGSGLWGMYSGFELCESAAIPGKEEYLDSEKYQIRPRNYQAPGNIVAEIAQLNRIRRQNPALQTHLGFKPYLAWNDNILLRQALAGPVQLHPGGHQPRSAQRAGSAFRTAVVGARPAGRRAYPGRPDERASLDLVWQDPVDAYRTVASAIRNLAPDCPAAGPRPQVVSRMWLESLQNQHVALIC